MTVKIEDMFGNAAYEFVDLIKADPLVSESSPSMDVNKDKFRSVQRSEKITQRAQDTSDKATADVAKRKMSAQAKVQLPNIKKEERLVDTILGELEEATPRPKATQRGKISKAEAQKRQAREDRKRAAQERRDDRAKAGIDALIGSDADRKAAAAARANPEGQRKKALKRTLADRMAKGAKEHGLDENRFASHGGRDTDAGSAYAKPSKGGNKKGVYTLKGKDGKPLFDKREKSNESTEIEEKLSTQYKDKTKLGQSSERKSLGRGSSIKDGSKKTGYESPKEFRDASMSLRKHRERFGDLAKEEVTINEKAPKYDKQGLDKFDRSKRMIRHMQDKYGTAKSGFGPDSKFRTGKDHSVANEKKAKMKEEVTIDERVRLEADNGNLLMVVAAWKGKSYQLTMFFPQPSMPTREEVESEIQKVYPGSRLMSYRITRRGEGQPIMQVVNSHSKNYLLNNGNIGEEVELAEDKREEKARRAELAKKHGIDLTKPGARAKLIRLMSADTKSKNRKVKGDTRTDKEVRKDRADDRKAFDRQRKDMEYRGKSKDEIKKSMKKMRDEVRSVNDPVNAPPSREKVRAKVGTKVDKPADAPKTGRNKPTAEKRADRKSYEAQQRRNAKEQQNEDWQKVNKGDKTDGMSKKAVAAYRRENPGSKLKTAVTGKVKKGSKDAKRRKSFCARSKGQQDMHNIDCSKTPDKPVCKARRRWKC